MDTQERRLTDKSPLTDRIWNIDAAGHGGVYFFSYTPTIMHPPFLL